MDLSTGDLALPAFVAIVAIVLFTALLALQTKKKSPQSRALAQLGDHGEAKIQTTVFVEENGQVVRRSTRPRKSTAEGMTPLKEEAQATPARATRTAAKVAKTPAAEAKTPTLTPVKRTPKATPAKASKTPAAQANEETTSPRTRTRRTPHA